MSAAPRTRADRLRLMTQLELAAHASELLRSKEEALERERVRMEGHATRSADEWERSVRVAADRLVRARMLGAGEELARLVAAREAQARVVLTWRRTMGVVHPHDVHVDAGPFPDLQSTAALPTAADAYRAALEAGGRHAATLESLRRLHAELDDTRRRRRAIDDRLRPRLQHERHDLDLRLDELDRDEALRVRMAHDAGARR